MASDDSTFVAGHFTVAFTGGGENDAADLDIGTTETGFTVRPQFYREDIRIDEFGDCVVDGIYRGFNVFLNFELVRWVADIEKLLAFVDSAAGWGKLDPGQIGKTMEHLAGKLVLTPVANINDNLETWTFHLVLPDGEVGATNLNTRLRRMSCNFIVIPVLAAGATQYQLFARA